MDQYFNQSKLLWRSPQLSRTACENLRRYINRKHDLHLANYHDLHKYSVMEYTFWLDLSEFLGIIFSVPPSKSQIMEPGKLPEVPIWFPGARLNYAENLLHRRDDGIACTEGGESDAVTHYSYRQLYAMVKRMAAALRVNGLEAGDRVAAIVTNTIDAVVIALAVSSVGGVFSTTATDMGTQGILDRYRQIQPKFVFAEIGVVYSGKEVDLVPKISEVVRDLSDKGLQQAILLPSRISGKEVRINGLANSVTLSTFLQADDGRELIFEQLPFSHPLYILYSSGTSGKPKCIVHSAGGVLLQTKKEIQVGFDISLNDTYFQYTTTGWMMWNFMLTGLTAGCRIILYDGSPFYPSLEKYLRFINDQNISCLGTSPRFLSEIQARGINLLRDIGPFEALRTIGSTGAPITPSLFEWTHNAFGGDIHLISTSGGTDVCTSFVTGSPSLPVYSGEIQCKSLGMKVAVFDPAGNNIEDTGRPGELVCTRPHPSLPVGFWGDETGQKFRDAYYNMYPGVWRQGDFMVINPRTKGIMILGRSDGVLNPSGIRFGSAEIYSVLEQFSEHLEDSLCVGQRRSHDKDERVILFVKMRSGETLSRALDMRIRDAIRKALSARHVPAYIFEVSDIPYTVNGKKIEIAVKQIISGSSIQPSGTVANPESLKLYYKYRKIEKVVGVPSAKL